jgi:hypothetical protein
MQKEFLNSTKHNGKSKEVVAMLKKSEERGKWKLLNNLDT